MPRRRATPRPKSRPDAPPGRRWRIAAAAGAVMGIVAAVWAWGQTSPEGRAARAEAAAKAGDWPAALEQWRAVNRTDSADARSWLGEARACLALGRAAQAERALARASAASPGEAEAWLLRLEILRLEDRPVEALRVGWEAYAAVPAPSRRAVLKALTLALLADTPDDLARATLARWVAADPDDADARVALYRRMASSPRAGDPDRSSRATALTAILGRHPESPAAREALVTALADAGDLERGRVLLDDWPADARDARYYRLRGRWELEYDHRPAEAVASFEKAAAELPHDWRIHYRLARALQALDRPADARRAAETVGRLREALDPAALGPRLDADLAALDTPKACLDLADLCTRVGLARLAEAWRMNSRQ